MKSVDSLPGFHETHPADIYKTMYVCRVFVVK